ncbi:rRNA maturation RNase YbeY [Olsenella urininfantis]|uniref:rRNA maturation RNase YbeY n=1 Tax=Olsenella urininfantis TaxID=1871033 RepID=UPI00098792D6|nr:rRNA maturation RNase YbeY [Olsenella urininfantis]
MARGDYDLHMEGGVSCPLGEEELFAVMDLVLHEEGVSRPCMVSLSVVSDDRMRELNGEWRGQDRCTDVLSLECERPDDPDLAPGEPCELGDVVLAPAYIARQAEGFGTTPADECRLLLVHGMLHLLGYDHLEEAEAQLMEGREDELLALLGTDHALDHVTLTRHREGEGA